MNKRLALARDSVADARLLLRHESRNVPVLLSLALVQALAALVGGNESDGPEALLDRVPAGHPAAGLAKQLRRRPELDGLERLIAAIDKAETSQGESQGVSQTAARRSATGETCQNGPMAFEAAAKTARAPGGKRRKPAEPDASAAASAREDAGTVIADGPTAFEVASSAQGPIKSAATERGVSSAAFWALMDRWRVTDADALRLLGSHRTLTGKNTRPRFRLVGEEAALYAALRRIDTALETMNKSPDWLHRRRGGGTPMSLLLADPVAGTDALLRDLNRAGLRAALRPAPREGAGSD